MYSSPSAKHHDTLVSPFSKKAFIQYFFLSEKQVEQRGICRHITQLSFVLKFELSWACYVSRRLLIGRNLWAHVVLQGALLPTLRYLVILSLVLAYGMGIFGALSNSQKIRNYTIKPTLFNSHTLNTRLTQLCKLLDLMSGWYSSMLINFIDVLARSSVFSAPAKYIKCWNWPRACYSF